MNVLLFMSILFVTFESFSSKPASGCNYNVDGKYCNYSVDGKCLTECPNGTRPYFSSCDYLTKEQTCTNLFPQKDLNGKLCGYASCYCELPTVRYNKECIKLEECPTVTECPKRTYLYSVENSNITPEPTCTDPSPAEDDTYGKVARYTACYCSKPYVRSYRGKCIKVDECDSDNQD